MKKKSNDGDPAIIHFVESAEWFRSVSTTILVTLLLLCTLLILILSPRAMLGALVSLSLLWKIAQPKHRPLSNISPKPRKSKPKALVVVGGPCTAELLSSLATLEWQHWRPLYIASDEDKVNQRKAIIFEKQWGRTAPSKDQPPEASMETVPYPLPSNTTISQPMRVFKLLESFYALGRHVLTFRPDVIFCGPGGLSISACWAAYILRLFLLKRITVVYRESFGCLSEPSQALNWAAPFCDVIGVQWKELQAKVPGAAYVGRFEPEEKLTEKSEEEVPAKPEEGVKKPIVDKEGYALATAGPAQFDELMKALESPQFVSALKNKNIWVLRVFVGDNPSFYKPRRMMVHAGPGFHLSFIEDPDDLAKSINRARLVIGHLPIDVLVEALSNAAKIIYVPNPKLQVHQEALVATRLASPEFQAILACSPSELASTFEGMKADSLKPFPTSESSLFAQHVHQYVGKYIPPAPSPPPTPTPTAAVPASAPNVPSTSNTPAPTSTDPSASSQKAAQVREDKTSNGGEQGK